MEKLKVKILRTYCPLDMTEEINAKLLEGWDLHGSLAVISDEDGDCVLFQMMVLYE